MLATPETGRDGARASVLELMFAPDRAMERQARAGRVVWFLLAAWTSALLLGGALALRVDARAATLRTLQASAEFQSMSDRQLADETRKAERLSQVASVAKGVAGPPVQLGLHGAAVVVMTWFLRGRLKGSCVLPVAAAALLPTVLANVLDAVAAFRHVAIPPDGVALVPRSLRALLTLLERPVADPWLKLAGAVDVFSLWGAVMLAYGIAAAGRIPKKRALIGTLVAWLCYRLLTRVAVSS